MARVTGLEPATSGVTGRRSNQLSYTRKALATQRIRTEAALTSAMQAGQDELSPAIALHHEHKTLAHFAPAAPRARRP